MRRVLPLLLLLHFYVAYAAIPSGYYNAAEGKTGAALKTQLCVIVGPHTERTYTNLWTDFQTTDKRVDGKVWDMYSNCSFTFVTDQDHGTGGSVECQYYNREHSFPKSWFNDASPMYTDLFHLYPTDKYVNNQRGNYPFGETSTPSNTFGNGSKVGVCTYSGYVGYVFEPIDEYKGDFARTYFYMVTAYDDKVASWSSDQLAGNRYPAFSTWSVSLFLKWNSLDPVSTKEKNRNDAVYSIQGNRNPFIDHPELAEYIWGSFKNEPWSLATETIYPKDKSTVYWNNDSHQIIIETNQQFVKYRLLNLNGILLLDGKFSYNTLIDTSRLQSGFYMIELIGNHVKTTKKLLINN